MNVNDLQRLNQAIKVYDEYCGKCIRICSYNYKHNRPMALYRFLQLVNNPYISTFYYCVAHEKYILPKEGE